jgi:hypothetical protein
LRHSKKIKIKELLIPIETFKTFMPTELIKTFKNVMPKELIVPIKKFKNVMLEELRLPI